MARSLKGLEEIISVSVVNPKLTDQGWQFGGVNGSHTDELNGVNQAGFASSQEAYEEAFEKVFVALNSLEEKLADGRQFLLGDALTESDIRLFVTLIRFDVAYHGLFKCNRKKLKDMPKLNAYLHRILAIEGIQSTVNIEHIKAGYYSIKALNPTGIVPVVPAL